VADTQFLDVALGRLEVSGKQLDRLDLQRLDRGLDRQHTLVRTRGHHMRDKRNRCDALEDLGNTDLVHGTTYIRMRIKVHG
jgi:hypothetical protein